MRILHLIDRMSTGGAQALVVSLAMVQKEMGNEVEVLEVLKSPVRIFPERLEESGIKVHYISEGSLYNPIRTFQIIPYLKGFDVVHVHLVPAVYWAAFAKIIRFSKIPLVYTKHSTGGHDRYDKVVKPLDWFVLKRVYKEVVACSEIAKQRMQERYKGLECTYISNGIDVKSYSNALPYSPSELIGINEKSVILTMVARFGYPKRQDVVVDAVSLLPDNYHVCFVGGDGGNMESIKDKVKQLNLVDRVHFLGIRSDVARVLQSSDVVCLASNFEGLSLSSVEGMSVGKPFLASNVDGLKEIVQGAGLLFDNNNPKELAEHLLALCSNRTYYQEISDKCFKRALQYDIHETAKQYLAIYKRK